MKLVLIGLAPLIALGLFNPSIAQTLTQTQQDTIQTDAFAQNKVDIDLPLYRAGEMKDPEEIRILAIYLSYLAQYQDSFDVLESAISAGYIQETAEDMAKLAYYLKHQDLFAESLPYDKKAAALGHPKAQILVAQTTILLVSEAEDKDCALVKIETDKAIESGMDTGEAKLFQAMCHFDRAKDHLKSQCSADDKQILKMNPAAKAELKTSKSILKSIAKTSPHRLNAKKWLFAYGDKPTLSAAVCYKKRS